MAKVLGESDDNGPIGEFDKFMVLTNTIAPYLDDQQHIETKAKGEFQCPT